MNQILPDYELVYVGKPIHIYIHSILSCYGQEIRQTF